MSTRHLFAATLAAFGISAAMAQEATPDTWMKSSGTRSRAELMNEVALARATGELDTLREYDIVDRHDVPALTRAEVLADLRVWRRAGLADFGRGEASPNIFSDEYRRAHARYAAMRASPEFAALVQSIAQQRGEAAVVATTPGARNF